MKNTLMVRQSLFLIGLSLACLPLSAQETPQQILAKARQRVLQATTYQSQASCNDETGKLSLQVYVAGKKYRFELVGLPSKTAHTGEEAFKYLIVSDGRTRYGVAWVGSMVAYNKKAGQPLLNKTMKASASGGNIPVYTLLPSIVLDGKPAYVVQVTTANVKGASSFGDKSLYCIDQATYRIKKIQLRNNQDKRQNMDIVFRNEKLNAPIPKSKFVFTPPAGALESDVFQLLNEFPNPLRLLGWLISE